MAVDNPGGLGRTGNGGLQRRNGFLDHSRLRWRFVFRIGDIKSIGLRQRSMRIGNACCCFGRGLNDRTCNRRGSEFHCRQYSHTQWDEEAQQHHSQHDAPPTRIGAGVNSPI
jgi:hypothetical protein